MEGTMPEGTPIGLPTAAEFMEFAKRSKMINLDVSVATLLESADSILRGRPGYVLFNIRCGMLIIDRPVLDLQREQLQEMSSRK
jgi:hypothetical protein